MGVRQVLRGDPETKQYLVFNDFSGGINTTDIDDAVRDSEFRMLKNVELGAEGGMVQNRKGFGDMTLLMELLDDKGVSLPRYIDGSQTYVDKCLMMRIVKNTNNAFAKFEQYATLADYITGMSPFDVKLHILFNFKGQFKILKIEKAIEAADFTATLSNLTTVHRDDFFPWGTASEGEWGSYGEIGGTYDVNGTDSDDLPVAPYYLTYGRVNLGASYLYYKSGYEDVSVFHDRIVSAEAVDYLDYTYILGTSISPQAGTTLYVYDAEAETMGTITRESCYKPNPYEVTVSDAALGFNVFAKEPLTYIKDQDIGIKSILGIFLTNTTTGAFLSHIPTSGDFTLNVIQYGNTMHALELVPVFRIGSTVSEKTYTLVSASDIGGIFQYVIEDLDVTDVSYFEIDVEKREPNYVFSSQALFDAYFDMENNYHFTTIDTLKIYKKTSGASTEIALLADTKLVTNLVAASFATEFSAEAIAQNSGRYFELYDAAGDVRYALYTYGAETWVENLLEADVRVPTLAVPVVGDLFELTLEGTYMAKYRTTGVGTANFTEIGYDPAETIVSLLAQIRELGATPNEKVISSVDLTGARMMMVNVVCSSPRMLYYKGNTLWFSEIGQFDYLPNRNFVMIPLEADDEITSVNFYRNNYIIFTKTSIYKMVGDYESAAFTISLVNGNVGCIAPYSVKGVNNALVFLSADGLYKLTANTYSDLLENVTKIDKKIKGLFYPNHLAEAVVYNEQYMLFLQEDLYDVLHYYFNIGASEHPFTVSKFENNHPEILAKMEQSLVSMSSRYLTEAHLFLYDKGYMDFIVDETDETELGLCKYWCRITTTRNSLGYPTHQKKYKSCYIKTYYSGTSNIYVTALVDDYVILDPNTYQVLRGVDGLLSYVAVLDPDTGFTVSLPLEIDELGDFDLGTATLGDSPFTIHQVIIGGKGNTIQLMLEHSSNGRFGISSIGHVFKVGKVKASR